MNKTMNLVVVLGVFFSVGVLTSNPDECCLQLCKFVPEHRKIELLNKVAKNLASAYELEQANGIITQEYRKCIKAIERCDSQALQLVKVFISKDFDIQPVLKGISKLHQQLGVLLDASLNLLKVVSSVESLRSSYNTVNYKRELTSSVELDSAPIFVKMFKQLACQQLCIDQLKRQFKEIYVNLSNESKLDKVALQAIRAMVLIKLMENPSRAIFDLSGKSPSELLLLVKTFEKSLTSSEVEKPQARAFLLKADHWAMFATFVRRFDIAIIKLLQEGRRRLVHGHDIFAIDDFWGLELEFFSKGLSFIVQDVRASIEADKLLKSIVKRFDAIDLECFSTGCLRFDCYFKNKFTGMFQKFFDVVVAIGIETSLGQESEAVLYDVADIEKLKNLAQSNREFAEAFLYSIDNRPCTPGLVMYYGDSSSTISSISSSSLRVRTSVESRIYGPVRESLQKSILSTVAQSVGCYKALIDLSSSAILQYLSKGRNIDHLCHKIRAEASACLYNLNINLSQYNGLQASGCLKDEFSTIFAYKKWFEFAYQRTAEFLAYVFKAKVAPTMDIYMRQDDLIDAYVQYERAYKNAPPNELIKSRQKLASASFTLQALKTPEHFFAMTTAQQIQSYYSFAQNFYGLSKFKPKSV